MFECALPRLCLVSAKGLRQDALGGRLTECEGTLSIRVTCRAHQSAPMTAFLKRDLREWAGCRRRGISAESSLAGLNEKHGTVRCASMTQAAGTVAVIGYTDTD